MAYTLYYPSEAGYEYSTGYKCRWAITVTPDNDANTSAVSAQFQTYRADVNYYHRFTTVLTVGNTTVSYRIPGGTALSSVAGAVNAWVAFGSPVTTTVAHGADGTGSLIWKFTDPGDGYGAFGVSAASAYGTINTKIVVANLSTTITLNTIPRASTISSISSNVTTGSALALSVSRANPAFYHKATFKYGNTVLATSSAFATSLSYTVPHSWMSYATTATTMSITVSVQTYSSSACTETRGDPVTATFTVTAAASIAPAITAVALSAYDSVNCTTAYVQGYSNVRAAITANNNACQGATINSYKVTVQNVTTSSTSATVTSSNKVTAAGTLTVTTTVTDTRGRSATRSDNITVLAYSAPVISGQSMFRCNASGVADEDGNYISLKATATVSGLNNTNTGTLTAAVGSTSYSMTSGTVRVVGTYDPDTTYTITFTLTDTVGTTVTYSRVLTTRVWAMNFASNGQGVAFGKACEVNKALAIPEDWNFYKGSRKLRDVYVDDSMDNGNVPADYKEGITITTSNTSKSFPYAYGEVFTVKPQGKRGFQLCFNHGNLCRFRCNSTNADPGGTSDGTWGGWGDILTSASHTATSISPASDNNIYSGAYFVKNGVFKMLCVRGVKNATAQTNHIICAIPDAYKPTLWNTTLSIDGRNVNGEAFRATISGSNLIIYFYTTCVGQNNTQFNIVYT